MQIALHKNDDAIGGVACGLWNGTFGRAERFSQYEWKCCQRNELSSDVKLNVNIIRWIESEKTIF